MDWKVMDKRLHLAVLLTTILLALGFTPNLAYAGVLPDPPPIDNTQGPRAPALHIIPYATPAAAFAALTLGNIEYMNWPLTAALLPLAVPPIQLAKTVESRMREFDINNNETCLVYPDRPSPTSVPSFRMALAHLTDKDYITELICGGFAARLDVPIPYSAFGWWNPDVTGANYPYGYDPCAAAALLDAAGFVEGENPNPFYDPTFPCSATNIRVYPECTPVHDNPHVGTDITGPPYEWRVTMPVCEPVADHVRVKGRTPGATLYRTLQIVAEWNFEILYYVGAEAVIDVTVTIPLQECSRLMIDYDTTHPFAGDDIDPLVFYSRNDDPDRLAAGDHLRDNMRMAGIPVQYMPGPSAFCFPPVMGAREYHIYTGGWSLDTYPTYLYHLYHTDWYMPYWYNYINPPCSRPERGISYDPNSDVLSAAIYYTESLETAKQAAIDWQQVFMDNCINIPLWSPVSYYAYQDLLGVVNMAGVGLENENNFLNCYRASVPTLPVRVGTIQPPMSLNILESEWTYEYSVLDRMHTVGIATNPYDRTIHQPWVVQDWHTTKWYDEEDGVNKTKVTYWIRKDVWYHTPVTGAIYREMTAQDCVFTASETQAFPGCWPYSRYNDVHHILVVDDYCFEVYYNAASYWFTYAADGYPFLPKDIWLAFGINAYFTDTFVVGTNFTDSADFAATEYPMVLGHNYRWATINLTKDARDYTIELFANSTVRITDWYHWSVTWHDCWNITDPPSKQLNPNTAIRTDDGFKPWLNFTYLTGLTLANGDSFTVSYYGGVDDTGLTPGMVPWPTIFTGVGEWYMAMMPGGIGGPFILGACRQFFMDRPLGEVDWRWWWDDPDETRGFDQTVPHGPCTTRTEYVAPRTGYFRIDIFDASTVLGAYSSTGNLPPAPRWFPGADLELPDCKIDMFDVVTVTGQWLVEFGHPPLDP